MDLLGHIVQDVDVVSGIGGHGDDHGQITPGRAPNAEVFLEGPCGCGGPGGLERVLDDHLGVDGAMQHPTAGQECRQGNREWQVSRGSCIHRCGVRHGLPAFVCIHQGPVAALFSPETRPQREWLQEGTSCKTGRQLFSTTAPEP